MSLQKVTRNGKARGASKAARGSRRGLENPSGKLMTLAAGLLTLLSLAIFGGTSYLAINGIDPIEFYSNLADPYMRFVNIPAGERREQIAATFQKVLSWDNTDIQGFLDAAPKDSRGFLDGYYLPGTYWVRSGASGSEVARQMLDAFNSKVSAQVLDSSLAPQSNLTSKVNLDTAVRIASIIQREAAGKQDMNLISGVIWNRLFKGMPLDMDATLQYVTGSSTNWWPQVQSKDKEIDSPFNTYENKGLPPIAIANPSIDAIRAAMNPAKTSCLYYLHDNNGKIHCSTTYAAQEENVQRYLIGEK